MNTHDFRHGKECADLLSVRICFARYPRNSMRYSKRQGQEILFYNKNHTVKNLISFVYQRKLLPIVCKAHITVLKPADRCI